MGNMGNEPYTMRPMTYSGTSGHSKNQIGSNSIARAKMLFASYRRTDAHDPDGYVAAIAAVLSLYDDDLMREVTDPRTGIGTSEKFRAFMPNAGELKDYCEGIMAHREKMKRMGPKARPVTRALPPPPQPGDRANIHVPQNHPRHAGLVEWSKTADERLWRVGPSSDSVPGIWVDLGTWENRPML